MLGFTSSEEGVVVCQCMLEIDFSCYPSSGFCPRPVLLMKEGSLIRRLGPGQERRMGIEASDMDEGQPNLMGDSGSEL